MGKTNIEWTDRVWNPIVGCSEKSPGCKNCYACRLAGTRLKHTERYKGLTRPGPNGPLWTGETRFIEKELLQPIRWRKASKVFVCDMGDLCHESVTISDMARVWAQMSLARKQTFQVLTKRPKRLRDEFLKSGIWASVPLPNVWLGVSIESPDYYDRIRILQQIPAAVRFLSLEPMLAPMPDIPLNGISWVIVGGESGPKRRPVNIDWMRDIRDQCTSAGVPLFVKQLSINGKISRDMNEWPIDMRIREFPNAETDRLTQ